jgi:thiamine biosynthesis lipoprotein
MSHEYDFSFRSMGSEIRFLIGPSLVPGTLAPEDAAQRERRFVLSFASRLSRFDPASELSLLNHDPRPEVPASALLCAAAAAGVWAAQRTGGLVDPTLVEAIERTGYTSSRDEFEPASLTEALEHAPARRPASPASPPRWTQVGVDAQDATIRRPPGVMIDTGGTGKGLCADAVAHRLSGYTRYVVDCGGDIAVGGVGAQLDPYEIEVEHPLTHVPIGTVRLGRGGIATSGLNVRIWRTAAGEFAHHLLDPSSGRPVWSGVIGATAVGDSALAAETLSKAALLLGPAGAREVLAENGGLIVHDDGHVEAIGPLPLRLYDTPPVVAGA